MPRTVSRPSFLGCALACAVAACGGDGAGGERDVDGGDVLADAGDLDVDAGAFDGGGPAGDPTVVQAPGFDSDVFRQAPSIAVLPDGRVHVAGGVIVRGPPGGGPGRSTGREEAEVLDTAEETFVEVDSLEEGRYGASATVLDDGRVLVVGGWGGPAGEFPVRRASAEVVAPDGFATSLLSGTMAEGRASHLAWKLAAGPNAGDVMVLGGQGPPYTVERFDVDTERFTPVAVSGAPAGGGLPVLLADGRVLLVAGEGEPDVFDRSFVFDPSTGAFTPSGAMTESRVAFSATLLADGRVLVVGGRIGAMAPLATAETWNPATGEWSATAGPLNVPRGYHAAARLGSGRVAIAGGRAADDGTDSVEIFDPESGLFTPALGALTNARLFLSGVSLPDGRAMFLGGQVLLPRGNVAIVSTVDFVAE